MIWEHMQPLATAAFVFSCKIQKYYYWGHGRNKYVLRKGTLVLILRKKQFFRTHNEESRFGEFDTQSTLKAKEAEGNSNLSNKHVQMGERTGSEKDNKKKNTAFNYKR